MAKSVTKRVEDSFGDDDIAAAKEYSDKVYMAWTDLGGALRRNAVYLFLLAAVFELLVYQSTSSPVTFASFSFADSSPVLIALPIVFAFLAYEGLRLSVRWVDLGDAYYALVKKIAPKMSENDLDLLIRPMLPAFWGVGMDDYSEVAQRSEKVMGKLTLAMGVIVVWIFPLLFEGQAYYKLFDKFGYHNFFLWTSLTLSIALMICAIVYMAIYSSETS